MASKRKIRGGPLSPPSPTSTHTATLPIKKKLCNPPCAAIEPHDSIASVPALAPTRERRAASDSCCRVRRRSHGWTLRGPANEPAAGTTGTPPHLPPTVAGGLLSALQPTGAGPLPRPCGDRLLAALCHFEVRQPPSMFLSVILQIGTPNLLVAALKSSTWRSKS